MKRRNEKGFTLVELIVVIAIIGIIAAILVPTMMNYIKKANAKADIASAKQMYNSVRAVLMENDAAYGSFYQHNTMKPNVTTVSNAGSESYKLVVVCKCTGAANSYYDNQTNNNWFKGNNETQTFCDALDANLGYTAEKTGRIMKHTTHPNGQRTDLWLICYRNDDPERIEIWAGYFRGSGNSGPTYRVYPDPVKEYTNP